MADPLPKQTPASPGRRRWLLRLALAPLPSCPPILALARATPAAPVVLGIDLAVVPSISATCIRIFDTAGRLRVVFGALFTFP